MEIVKKEFKKSGAKRLTGVKIEVGKMAAVEPKPVLCFDVRERYADSSD